MGGRGDTASPPTPRLSRIPSAEDVAGPPNPEAIGGEFAVSFASLPGFCPQLGESGALIEGFDVPFGFVVQRFDRGSFGGQWGDGRARRSRRGNCSGRSAGRFAHGWGGVLGRRRS